MPANGRFDGHIVQGHVDLTGICTSIKTHDGSWEYHFQYPLGHVTVEKGSICVNGTSLTVVESGVDTFSVAIIPYTYEYTIFHQLNVGDRVNLEFDILGKYMQKLLARQLAQYTLNRVLHFFKSEATPNRIFLGLNFVQS